MGVRFTLGAPYIMKKFRAYDSKVLADTYAITQQFQSKIEELIDENKDVTISELPFSLVPTDTFYAILLCYDVMYHALCTEHLIKDAHTKPSGIIH